MLLEIREPLIKEVISYNSGEFAKSELLLSTGTATSFSLGEPGARRR
uniref:Uncharacterized protein n=1 Tax=Anguilla anguilla TaxID=7936 RepID=A0A0E9U5E5_ANGAN